MDDWTGKPWRRYLVVAILATIAIAVGVAYVMSRVAPSP
jgi:anti-sigma-K factor RskA